MSKYAKKVSPKLLCNLKCHFLQSFISQDEGGLIQDYSETLRNTFDYIETISIRNIVK
jgi:hypothetical protein